jgi:N-acetylmuramoyl-L-alanine amidase
MRPRVLPRLLVLALFAAGCGGKHPPVSTGPGGARAEAAPEPERPTVAPGGTRALPGYERRVEPIAGLDTTPLRGRRIAIDPGHGGRFPGSIGVHGLTEAEVNLGVALDLWGLLVDAGADVMLTRTADRDFTSPIDSTLRGDLAARTAKANAFDPEVFLSIHHNADAGARHDLNETQTYYKFSDPEASYDLGTAVHRHLALNLGIGADRLLPGNYFVVRNAAGPAVLGESSYLTNPEVESRLALAAKQRLEAEAYFLGLLDYFKTGVPRITATRIEPVTTGADAVDGSERPWLVAVTDRAPGVARLTLDGAPVDTAQIERVAAAPGTTAWRVRYRPPAPLTDGRHRVEWAVRATFGNWSKARRDSFDVDLPIARTELVAVPAQLAPGQVAGLTLRALDRHGRAVSDTVVARFVARVGAVLVDSLGRAVGPGEARAYARVTGGSVAEFSAQVIRPRVRAELAGPSARVVLAPPSGASHAVSGFVRTQDGRPIASARVVGDSLETVTNADGFFALEVATASPTAEAPGYVTASASAAAGPIAQLRLVPIGGGALIGRRVAIDPVGGGADTTGMMLAPAPTPIAASADTARLDSTMERPVAASDTLAARRAQALEADANLRVALALREDLEAAGAQVVLTRTQPDSLTAIDRLRITEGFNAERVVSIAHRAPGSSASVGHYFSSPGGTALARRVAARLDGRGATTGARVVESASYLVQQTAAVAVAVNAPDARAVYVSEPARAERRLKEEAYAIYLAMLEDFGADPAAFLPFPMRVVGSAGSPLTNLPVVLDGRWTLLTDDKGQVRFDGLPGGAVVTFAAGDFPVRRFTLPPRPLADFQDFVVP